MVQQKSDLSSFQSLAPGLLLFYNSYKQKDGVTSIHSHSFVRWQGSLQEFIGRKVDEKSKQVATYTVIVSHAYLSLLNQFLFGYRNYKEFALVLTVQHFSRSLSLSLCLFCLIPGVPKNLETFD